MNFRQGVYRPFIGVWYSLTSRRTIGTNIYEKDWDVAVILDTCRVDAIRELQNEYDFINDVGSVLSVGSSTPEWLINTFTMRWEDQIRGTTRISANGFDEYILVRQSDPPELSKVPFSLPDFSRLPHSKFDHLEILYGGEFHNERLGTVPPNHVTDRGIAVARERDWDRLMLHYVQPHAPYISNAISKDGQISEIESRPMWALRNGRIDKATGWDMYLDNLRLVLNSVKLLLENLDAGTVVLTADHGESFGEYGGKFGHIDGYLTPQVRKVPWITTTASDEETIEPDSKYHQEIDTQEIAQDNQNLKDHLEDLGYF